MEKEFVSTLVIVNRSTVWEGNKRPGPDGNRYTDIIQLITTQGRIRWHNEEMIPAATTRKKLTLIEA